MANIQGLVSSSLNELMQNVTMSFFTASGDITYITYTDVNGIYTQSVDDNWTGSLNPTGSGYQFFYSFNNSGSFSFTASALDRTQNWTGVKNYTSGSGVGPNPYIILNHEDMYNVRFRTLQGTSYRLGSNIDLSYFSNWMPIPNDSTEIFYGNFNGGNYTISNMTINNLSLPETTGERFYGLFGHIIPSGSQHDINFNSCSINLLNNFKLHTNNTRYFGIFSGQYEGNNSDRQNLYNIRVKNSTVKYVSETGAGAGTFPIYMGGIIGYTRDEQVDIKMYSCSVENSIIVANAQTGSKIIRVGGLAGTINPYQFVYGPNVFYSYVKNCYIFGCSGNSVTVGAMDGLNANFENCYALNNTISSSWTASAFMFSGRGAAQTNKCYVAGTQWGNTPIQHRMPFIMTSSAYQSKTAGYCYYESGTIDYPPITNFVIGVTGSLTENMKKYINYPQKDFYNIWDIDSIINRPSASFYNILNDTPNNFVSQSLGGYNFRNLVTASVTDGTSEYCRIILKSNPNINWSFLGVSIMERVGNTFTGSNAVQVTFNGSNGGTVFAGQDLESDTIKYILQQGKDYFVHFYKSATSVPIPLINMNRATGSYTKNNSTNYTLNLNYTTDITTQTSSYGVYQVIGININTGSSPIEKNGGYPYFIGETFPTAIPGLTLYYDSRVGYVSASNIWTDLSGNEINASTVWTYPTSSHLYFGNEFGGTASASFAGLLVSHSFGIELWTSPTTSSGQLTLFTTTSGSFPRIESYIMSNSVYFGYQGTCSIPMEYISSSNIIMQNKFNHIAFYVSGNISRLWVNGIFFDSMSVYTNSWTGGTIGIIDTEQINPYFGYIDVFKVWNGMPIDITETNNYHNLRNYIGNLPTVPNPQ